MSDNNTPQQEQLAALFEVSSRLGTTLDLSELFNLVMDSIIQLTEAERGFLMLTDGLGELQVVCARNVDSEDIVDGSSMSISRTVVRRAVDRKSPILTDNAQEDERFAANQSVVGYQLRSIMCAPLMVRGRVIGAAFVDNRLMAGAFNQSDLELLVMFANQAAMAIENARLFQQTDQALARRVEELTLFQRIDRELHKTLDLNHVLNLALDWAVDLTYADGGSIGLIKTDEAGQQKIHLLAYRTPHKELNLENKIIPLTHPVVKEVFDKGGAVQTPFVTAEQAIDSTPASVQLVVPIKQEGEIIGIITLESHLVTVFVEEDVEFVMRMADRAAVAIKNASLYEQIQAVHEARSKFTSMVTHELRLPLTSIKGYTDLILKGLVGELSEQQTDMLNIVKRNANRMSVLLSDLSDINRLESGRMNFNYSSFDIRDVIQEVTTDLKEPIEAKKQELVLKLPETAVYVYADRDRVGQIVSNLLSNANKYTANHGQLTIVAHLNEQNVQVDISDNGIGISVEDQAHLFQQFFRSNHEAVRQETGWGLGLTVVQMFVTEQGGEITWESELGVGSRFSFTLPLAEKADIQ